LPDFRAAFPQPIRDALGGPAEPLAGLDRHEPVDDLRDDVRGREADDLLILGPVQEVLACQAVSAMGCEAIKEHIGVHEERLTALEGVERHGPSSGSLATSSIR